ncbi:hypothetical protein [Granulosicoccus antarcticus]|uniref:Uncharacterized protein n=1 Tax=Granulosicoccus antarcticus IMCC3135 TaxID=1192854 RepID=A0A2Z2P678_9GAMM|nr:hypothetical protein [Granulosicoccus antarcticus]ASJ76207.1 hypothetical protein IMCC3135_30790 [Granulosicoccus antarcticus IMCC3135]
MAYVLSWLSAVASFIGLGVALQTPIENLSGWKLVLLIVVILVFGISAIYDAWKNYKSKPKKYRNEKKINEYMYSILADGGRCEICSRDASWIEDDKIFDMLKNKASRGELVFFLHQKTDKIMQLTELGADLYIYGDQKFEPLTRFTIVNSGNRASSFLAIGRKKPNEPHVIEELDSSHPTYSLALDLLSTIKTLVGDKNDG